MRKILVAVFMVLSFAGLAAAQVPSSGNVFFGYSYYSTDLSTTWSTSVSSAVLANNRVNTNGWEGSLEGKVIPFLGIVADFDGHYGSQTQLVVQPAGSCPSSGCQIPGVNFSEENVLFGPRVSAPLGKFRPFGEFLVGLGHASFSRGPSDNSLATAVGGGLDYRLIHRVAWRFQGHYVHTGLFGGTQNNVRLSTGIVLRF